jgi:hypothetical protein
MQLLYDVKSGDKVKVNLHNKQCYISPFQCECKHKKLYISEDIFYEVMFLEEIISKRPVVRHIDDINEFPMCFPTQQQLPPLLKSMVIKIEPKFSMGERYTRLLTSHIIQVEKYIPPLSYSVREAFGYNHYNDYEEEMYERIEDKNRREYLEYILRDSVNLVEKMRKGR